MKTTLYLQNLKCGTCETTLINRLSALKSNSNISIKFQYATITFEHENKADVEEVKQILSNIGYSPFDKKNDLGEKTKSYVSCKIGRIKK
ncbi:hypothetical protein GCM10023314_12790 [Algibacter agarivorans]|uniref:HMA domain-containing protein n=1 Tax=Algibacter agarivorans TaxID=1109741 RepID=A0ABP9GJ73_9FLAO